MVSKFKGAMIIIIITAFDVFILSQATHIYDILYVAFAGICFIRIIALNIKKNT